MPGMVTSRASRDRRPRAGERRLAGVERVLNLLLRGVDGLPERGPLLGRRLAKVLHVERDDPALAEVANAQLLDLVERRRRRQLCGRRSRQGVERRQFGRRAVVILRLTQSASPLFKSRQTSRATRAARRPRSTRKSFSGLNIRDSLRDGSSTTNVGNGGTGRRNHSLAAKRR